MSESPSGRATRRRHAGGSDEGEEPVASLVPKLLGPRNREWSISASVTSSPLIEHLALSAFDTFVAACSLCVLLTLRPPWSREVSDDVRSDEVTPFEPSVIYVALLASICGCGGVLAKTLVVVWCLNERRLTQPAAAAAHAAASINGYEGVRLRVIASLFVSWIFVVTAVLHLLGAPLACIASSFLLSIFFATVGVAAPYASALAEACRAARWDAAAAAASDEQAANQVTSGHPVVTSPPAIVSLVDVTLRCLDSLCFPLVFLCHKLQVKRLSRSGSATSSVLHPQELGNLLVFLSVFPLIACGFACLLSCILLPMDWPTVYIVYPSPLVMAITVAYPLASLATFLLLLLLPVFCSFPNRYARAYPVLQELMLRSGGGPS
ncbi:hypothetical protein Emed_005793 [Eimeria media]